jgi:predicted Zn-dependent protease
MLARADLEALCESLLRLVSADEAEVRISDAEDLLLRSANNDVTSNGLLSRVSVDLTVSFGRRSASTSLTQTDEASLREAVRRVEAMAKLAPEDPEHLPPPPPQPLENPPTWSEETAALDPAAALARLRPVLEAGRAAGIDGAGYLERRLSSSAYANSQGAFAFERSSTVGFSLTARTPAGRGSGWASTQATELSRLDLGSVAERAIAKALASRNPAARPAGRTTVVLEAAAARDLLGLLAWGLDRRSFDEGRSFLNGLVGKEGEEGGGGDPVGKALFGELASLVSDPMDAEAPCSAHAGGLPRRRTAWIERGVLRALPVGRFWAEKTGVPPLPGPGNLLMPGEGKSLDQLLAGVEDGVLVTRLWYLRLVEPQSLLYTGLTRDGTFAIRDGAVAGPVNNYRFNESPAKVLAKAVASGVPERVLGSESGMPALVPPLVVRDFNLSSVSEAS